MSSGAPNAGVEDGAGGGWRYKIGICGKNLDIAIEYGHRNRKFVSFPMKNMVMFQFATVNYHRVAINYK